MKKVNLKNLVKKDGKTFTKDNVQMYNWICDRIKYTPYGYVKFYGTSSTKNGINDTWTRHIKQFLSACGVGYNIGNDAPRGGKNGDFVAVRVEDIKGIIRCVEKYCNYGIERGTWEVRVISITIK